MPNSPHIDGPVHPGEVRDARYRSLLNKGTGGRTMGLSPSFLQVEPGDTVTFTPVDKGHNAETILDMIPADAETWKGKTNEQFTVTLTVKGLYDIALPEPAVPVEREGGAVRHLAIQSQPAEPAIGEVEASNAGWGQRDGHCHGIAHHGGGERAIIEYSADTLPMSDRFEIGLVGAIGRFGEGAGIGIVEECAERVAAPGPSDR